MSSSSLVLHRGARIVTREELERVSTPEPVGRWRPVPFGTVLNAAESALYDAGYGIVKESLALSRGDDQFFGTLDLSAPIPGGSTVSVGIRSSHDKSLSLGWCCGTRTFVCDNLSFSSNIVIARKHTVFGADRYIEAIAVQVRKLADYREMETRRVQWMMETALTDEKAESLLLRAYEQGILTQRSLPKAIAEWRQPSFEDFDEKNYWRMQNGITLAIGKRAQSNPQAHALATIRLGHLLSPEVPPVLAS